jgi:type III restriction enzyme
VRGLMAQYAITDVSLLGLDRFRLRDAVEKRIQQHRASERKAVFQSFLLPDSALTVSDTYALNFKDIVYEPSWRFEGSYQFKKHYFGTKPGELREITAGGDLTEEFRCAQYLDQHPQIDYWARNLARKIKSFRFRTSTDWFYPDFIAKLTDGRVLAIEYKGAHLYDGIDAEEKRAIGAVWESRSNGHCLFVMPTAGDLSAIARKIGG